MLESLKVILDVQELDMKMIRLMRLKKERKNELGNIQKLKGDLNFQLQAKSDEVLELKKDIRLSEGDLAEVEERIKKLEKQQSAVKKVEEFNALSQELNQSERQKSQMGHRLSDFGDKLIEEEKILENLQESFKSTESSSCVLEKEILESVDRINEEGRVIKADRDILVEDTEPETFKIYESLLKNKKDRVLVPIEERSCSGCHIMLTAQHENLVRKGERLVFCEHCSRIVYWPESESLDGAGVTTRRRRRKVTTTTTKS
jgi:uncharacterized protein